MVMIGSAATLGPHVVAHVPDAGGARGCFCCSGWHPPALPAPCHRYSHMVGHLVGWLVGPPSSTLPPLQPGGWSIGGLVGWPPPAPCHRYSHVVGWLAGSRILFACTLASIPHLQVGGSLASVAFNLFQHSPREPDMCIIDVQLVLLFSPVLLLGTSFGREGGGRGPVGGVGECVGACSLAGDAVPSFWLVHLCYCRRCCCRRCAAARHLPGLPGLPAALPHHMLHR